MQLNKMLKALIIFLFLPVAIFGQDQKGKIFSNSTHSALAYVNVVICGRNIGTVSDEAGNFKINLNHISDEDSLYFSMIGYEPQFIPVHSFREDPLKNIYLNPLCYSLDEVVVMPPARRKAKAARLGTPVHPNYIKSGFADNTLGSEMGVKVHAKGRIRLKSLNLNVATCTFDSVTYRLNIYQSGNQTEYKNILTEPIYISFSNDSINQHLSFDLSRYSIVLEGNAIIALELFKDLGEGKLMFHTNMFAGSTHFRKTNDANWAETTGIIGMYLNGYTLR